MQRPMATLEMARRYFRLFVNRAAYTLQSGTPDSRGKYYYYRPKGDRRLTVETILKHLDGQITIALYAINPKTQRSKWVAIDADYARAFEDLFRIQVDLRKDGIQSALERSRRGAHLWVFAHEPLLARDCRVYIYNLALRLNIRVKLDGKSDGIEVFPRQDHVEADEFGNAIRGPLGVHRAAGGKRFWFYGAAFNPQAQLEYLESLEKITECQMRALVDGLTMPEEFRPRPAPIMPPYDPARADFCILDYVPKGRRSGKDYRTRCPSCGAADKDGNHLAVSVADPRKYRCWAGCSKEQIRAAVGCPIKSFQQGGTWQTHAPGA